VETCDENDIDCDCCSANRYSIDSRDSLPIQIHRDIPWVNAQRRLRFVSADFESWISDQYFRGWAYNNLNHGREPTGREMEPSSLRFNKLLRAYD